MLFIGALHRTRTMTTACYVLLFTMSFHMSKTSANHEGYYSTGTPYEPPPVSLVLPSPPSGFRLLCAQMLVRHGCRTLKYRYPDHLANAVWMQAKEEGALTDVGYQFGKDLRHFISVNDRIGRSESSGLGKLEQEGIAHRLVKRLLPLFAERLAHNASKSIRVISSGQTHAEETLNTFVASLPPRLVSLVEHEPANTTLLRVPPKPSIQNNYEKDDQLRSLLLSIRVQPRSRQMARKVLARLYSQTFIDRLADGHYSFTDYDSGNFIKNEVDAVVMLWILYSNAPCLREEGIGSLFEKYFQRNEAAWFAYLQDARDYYKSGPGLLGRSIAYDTEQVLLDDFLLDTHNCSQVHATHFLRARFTHGTTMVPFVALLKIPILSDKPTPLNDTYTYENNAWRGALISPMSANIQWEIYRRHHHRGSARAAGVDDDDVLVRMLLNEYPVPFKDDCQPFSERHPLFCTLAELKRCYSPKKQ